MYTQKKLINSIIENVKKYNTFLEKAKPYIKDAVEILMNKNSKCFAREIVPHTTYVDTEDIFQDIPEAIKVLEELFNKGYASIHLNCDYETLSINAVSYGPETDEEYYERIGNQVNKIIYTLLNKKEVKEELLNKIENLKSKLKEIENLS